MPLESGDEMVSARQNREDCFRILMTMAPVGVFVTDPMGRCLFVNERWCEIAGLSPDEAMGEGWINALHPEDCQRVIREWNESVRSSTPFKMKYRFMTPQGKITWLSGRARAVYDSQGDVTEYIGTIYDITRRRKAEKALRESERQLSTMISNLQGLAFRCQNDKNWTMEFISEGCVGLTGYQPADLIGNKILSYADLIHPDDRDSVWEKIQKALAETKPYHIEYRIRTASGDEKWVSEQGMGVYSDNGDLQVLEGLVTDVSDLVQTQKALRKLNLELEERVEDRTAQLQEANLALEKSLADLKQAQEHLVQSEKMAALGALVAGVAHEINTPLGIGVTAASYLEQKTRELEELFEAGRMKRADFEKYLNTALESTASTLTNLNRAADLIKSFKQVAVDQTSEERRRFRLEEYIENILLSLRPRYKRTRHTIRVNCPDNLEIISYPGAFSQIITNLLINSLIHGFEHTEQGEMVLDISVEGDQLLLEYHDNGGGMDADQVQKVFDPFFTSKRVQESTGLGMHIVYNLVTRLLNGRIECHSALGQGTKFTIEIPINEDNGDE